MNQVLYTCKCNILTTDRASVHANNPDVPFYVLFKKNRVAMFYIQCLKWLQKRPILYPSYLPKNFQNRCCVSRENEGLNF